MDYQQQDMIPTAGWQPYPQKVDPATPPQPPSGDVVGPLGYLPLLFGSAESGAPLQPLSGGCLPLQGLHSSRCAGHIAKRANKPNRPPQRPSEKYVIGTRCMRTGHSFGANELHVAFGTNYRDSVGPAGMC